MQVISTIAEFQHARGQVKGAVGLVPTMGYLHQGHLELVRRARAENDTLAVSIFVNPSQFGPHEDFESYPRDMDRDLSLLKEAGTDVVFAPSADEIYPAGFDTWVNVEGVTRRLEGESRPTHFRGVSTVVAKLFNIVRPDRAYFGQKDGQQVAVIQRMVHDLNMDVDIVVVPTVREPDGLALSSRNQYLTPEQRLAAGVIYRALQQAESLWAGREKNAEILRKAVRGILALEPLVAGIDYVSVADISSLEELDTIWEGAMVSVAARIGLSSQTPGARQAHRQRTA